MTIFSTFPLVSVVFHRKPLSEHLVAVHAVQFPGRVVTHMSFWQSLLVSPEIASAFGVVRYFETVPRHHKLAYLQFGICDRSSGHTHIRSPIQAAVEYILAPARPETKIEEYMTALTHTTDRSQGRQYRARVHLSALFRMAMLFCKMKD